MVFARVTLVGTPPHLRGQKGAMGLSSCPRQGKAAVLARTLVLVLAVALGRAAAPAQAADGPFQLSVNGTSLGSTVSAGPSGDLRVRVDLAGDVPTATHVWAVIGGAHLRQRTEDGFWIDWSGRPEDLIDNRFPVESGHVTFKLLDEHLGGDNQGISLWVGYRANGELKRGYLGITPGSGS